MLTGKKEGFPSRHVFLFGWIRRARGDDGGGGEEGGGGGERREGGPGSVRLLPAVAHALQPHDRLPRRRRFHRHQGGRERDRGGAVVSTATGDGFFVQRRSLGLRLPSKTDDRSSADQTLDLHELQPLI